MDNRDSDQSISENEEDIDANWLTNPKTRDNKDWLKMFTFWNEEDSKFAQASGKDVTDNSDEEAISDVDENSVIMGSSCIPKSMKVQKDCFKNYKRENDRDEASTWSAVNKEAEELILLHDKSGSSSSRTATLEAKKIVKGAKGKAKPKFSIHYLSHKGESSLPSIVKDEKEKLHKVGQIQEELEDLEDIVMEHSMPGLLQGITDENDKQSEVQVAPKLFALEHRDTEHSVSELLDGLQEKNEPVEWTTTLNMRRKNKKHQITRKRNMCQLGDRILDKEDPDEPMDGDTSSEDEAPKHLNHGPNQMRIATLESKRQTMSDRFHEAFNDTTGNDSGTRLLSFNHAGGYYSRLQQVMQTEKERYAEFSKKLLEMSGQEDKCICVKIISRCLEAKLTVCECSYLEKNKNSHCPSPKSSMNIAPKTTIIFNSRMCSDVEIEVGNIIRIHPPWNEVQLMGKDKSMILCTYFSLIST